MSTVTVYRHGVTCGVGNSAAVPPVRTEVIGWSASAIRRNLLFLYSVDETGLTGSGVALTLTIGKVLPTPEEWGRARDLLFMRFRRLGMVRLHWVTEWQRRGFPHLHLAVWFPERPPVAELRQAWLDLTEAWGSAGHCQAAVPIWDVVGWNQYVSKHAARGLNHYQRSPENVPATWRTGTGRMWGKLGDWPLQAPVRVELSDRARWAYRRMVRGWRLANARADFQAARKRMHAGQCLQALRRIRSARGMLRCPLPDLSRVRGVSEWISEGLTLRMLEALGRAGHELTSV